MQDAFLRALKYFGGFRGEGAAPGRAWLLAIVRNTAYTWRRRAARTHPRRSSTRPCTARRSRRAPGIGALEQRRSRETLAQALDRLPPEFREVIVLRELEGLSYKEISEVADVPVGTVMSRLSRARKRLQEALRAADEER